jgi:Rrf2 family transcriptional regulator, iron-sulfur cluster assembly transcription factor
MSVLFSRQCEYALQAILYITKKSGGGYTDIKEISKSLGIPHHFLAKILQSLSKRGLLRSQKGPSGGFALSGEPDTITLYHIVEAIDGNAFLHECVLGLPVCGGDNPCPVHEKWGKLREEIHKMLTDKTIAEMVRALHAKTVIGERMHVA